jgi:tetratricopeptide (TPR) repeat protein
MPTQRNRGIAATVAGLQKLREVKAAGEADGTRLTYEGIADRISWNSQASVDPRTVRRFFKGEGIDRDYVLAICKALGVEVTEIVDPNEWNFTKSRQTSQPVAIAATLRTAPPTVRKWQGRQDEINELQTALSNDEVCLIGITAAGGYGKSALAVKFKEQLTPDWQVLWVNFNQAYGFPQFGRWLLERLGFGEQYDETWSENDLIYAMVEGLKQKLYLLVLDNFETVVTAEGESVYSQFLKKWLDDGITSKLLLTSREQPTFSDNLLLRCHWLVLKGLAEADAIRLVTEDYGLMGTYEELAHFVNRMDRHPLLMQLVSSRMRVELGKGVCVTEAENFGLDLFTVEGYHRDVETSVGEVVAVSLARLSPRLGTLLKRLSVLRIAFDEPLAQGLEAEATKAELRYLARLSLLQEFPPKWEDGKQTEQQRFEFLTLIQTFVQQQADSELLRSAHQAALDYFLAHLPAPPWESLEDLTAYLEAFHHAGELREWQLAFDILNGERGGEGKNKSVDQFLDLQGFYRLQVQLYEQVVAGSQREQDCYRKSLNPLGICCESLGEYEKAISYHQQSLEINKAIGNQHSISTSLSNLGLCYYYLGEYEKAISYHQQSLEIDNEIGKQSGIAASLGNLGSCYFALGEHEKAISYLEQSLEINKLIGNESNIAASLGNLGSFYKTLGEYEKAISYHQQSLKIDKAIGKQSGIARSFNNLGNCYSELAEYEKAIAYYKQSLEISQTIGNQSGIAISFCGLGICYSFLGEYKEAINHHQQSLEINQAIGNQSGIAISLHNIGETLIKLENYSDAETKIQESLVISQEINFKEITAYNFKALAEIAYQTNQPQLALTHCQAALTLSQELGIPLVKDCEELLAKIQEDLGE